MAAPFQKRDPQPPLEAFLGPLYRGQKEPFETYNQCFRPLNISTPITLIFDSDRLYVSEERAQKKLKNRPNSSMKHRLQVHFKSTAPAVSSLSTTAAQ